ncbi:adenylate/guanylate cyclase domain-containing protein [Marinobacterium rhizophilum]|uniref:adenylate/guanylate cyclase domain-containing protein n=1 Tax=Marinobacterium rhizophilum TaxID=420402 RepID=UPI0012EC7CFC|nr:adenylate/guanylate cyclase domain-containing protein [Marinobacterium rhizophilum]
MTAYILLVSLPVVITLAVVSYMLSASILQRMAIDRFDVIAEQREREIYAFMTDQADIVRKIAAVDELRDAISGLLRLSPGNQQYQATYMAMADTLFRSTFLDYGSAAATDLTGLMLLNQEEGRVFFSTDPDQEGEVYNTDPFFIEGREHTYIQPVYLAPDTGLPTLIVSTPLTGRDGEPLGVLAARIRVPVLVDIVSQRSGLGRTGESYLVDTGHHFLSMARFGAEAYPSGAHSQGIDTAVQGQNGSGLYTNYAGQAVIGSYRWLPDLELALLTEIRVSEALQPATRLGWLMLLLGLAAVALLALGTYLIARQIARPILAVTATTRQIATGDLSIRAKVMTEDETGVLAHNFNRMIDRLQVTLADLALEQKKSEQLLLNILPGPIAERLKEGEDTIADSFAEVTILFADIVNFTPMSSNLPAVELVSLLNEIFSEFDRLSELHGLEKIKTIGDAYMVGAGLPIERKDHARVIAEMALDMLEAINSFNQRHQSDLHMRIGINSGPVVAGVIGTHKFIYDIWGDAVNIAARMESQGVEGCIQVTENTWKHLRNDYLFDDRGLISIKGKGKMHTYMLRGRKHHAPTVASVE